MYIGIIQKEDIAHPNHSDVGNNELDINAIMKAPISPDDAFLFNDHIQGGES